MFFVSHCNLAIVLNFRFRSSISQRNQMKKLKIDYPKVISNTAIQVHSQQENVISFRREELSCQPKKVIVFHKTHKCSSTTLQNILLRYAYKNELNVVVPKENNTLPEDIGFQASSLNDTEWSLEFLALVSKIISDLFLIWSKYHSSTIPPKN